MVSELVEGFNKIRKPLFTGYCILFIGWLYAGDNAIGIFRFSEDREARLVSTWGQVPDGAKAALASFLALSIGGFVDYGISHIAVRAGRKLVETWVLHDVLDEDTSFGVHAAFRLYLTAFAVAGASWRAALTMAVFGLVLAATAAMRDRLAPRQRTLRAQGSQSARAAIKRKLIDLSGAQHLVSIDEHPSWLEDKTDVELDTEAIAKFIGSNLVARYPGVLEHVVADLRFRYGGVELAELGSDTEFTTYLLPSDLIDMLEAYWPQGNPL